MAFGDRCLRGSDQLDLEFLVAGQRLLYKTLEGWPKQLREEAAERFLLIPRAYHLTFRGAPSPKDIAMRLAGAALPQKSSLADEELINELGRAVYADSGIFTMGFFAARKGEIANSK